jgi:hypothetical protein
MRLYICLQYWRFHEEGHSAVSTIEAVAHAATAAGCPNAETLLLLFRLQRFRVLTHVDSGAKLPRAMMVGGTGDGGWSSVSPYVGDGGNGL